MARSGSKEWVISDAMAFVFWTVEAKLVGAMALAVPAEKLCAAGVAALPADRIAAVHVCDGLHISPGEVPDQSVWRNVWTGARNIPFQEWVGAIRNTIHMLLA